MSTTDTASCIFCRIARGDMPAQVVHEEDDLLAFRDVEPKAPTHILIVPRAHVESLEALDDVGLGGRLLQAARAVAREEDLDRGWRVVTNVGPEGGQSVPHLHLHLLGGRILHWPPG
jgi:histidine triad (HIT) family protein